MTTCVECVELHMLSWNAGNVVWNAGNYHGMQEMLFGMEEMFTIATQECKLVLMVSLACNDYYSETG